MSEVARVDGGALAIRADQNTWDATQIAALRQLGVNGAPDPDLQVFFHFAKRTGLDPFARQVYMIPRQDQGSLKWTIQTGIDGFRLVADRTDARTKTHRGYEDTQWYSKDTGWVDVWDSDEPPAAARVTVLRAGQRFPAVAHYREYVSLKNGQPTRMWRVMPANQVSKCAEALALRKAYPQDLSGVYLHEEMQQATNEAPDAAVDPAVAAVRVAEFKDRALAATGDTDALQATWQDARSAGVLDEAIEHEGAKGTLGALILHLRTLPKPDIVDAEVVEEPKAKSTPTQAEVDEALNLPRATEGKGTLSCGCDSEDVWKTGEHRADCPKLLRGD